MPDLMPPQSWSTPHKCSNRANSLSNKTTQSLCNANRPYPRALIQCNRMDGIPHHTRACISLQGMMVFARRWARAATASCNIALCVPNHNKTSCQCQASQPPEIAPPWILRAASNLWPPVISTSSSWGNGWDLSNDVYVGVDGVGCLECTVVMAEPPTKSIDDKTITLDCPVVQQT